MNEFINKIYDAFENKKQNFNDHKKECIPQAKEIIQWAKPLIDELNQYLKTHEFESEAAEIYFFKKVKPKIMAQFIFYNEVLRIEAAKPPSKALQNKYYKNELEKIIDYFKKEHNMYKYYRANGNEFDALYFTRNSQKNILETECFQMNIAPRISTCYDFKLAKIMSNDVIAAFIENQIIYLNTAKKATGNTYHSKWRWTGTKTDLTELIYALHAKKSINNGNTDIMEIATDLGKLLNIEICQTIYRNFTDIKNRKTSKTRFLDTISESLLNKIQEEEF